MSRDYQKIFDLNDVRNPIKRLGKSGTRKIDILDIKLHVKELSIFERAKKFNKLIEFPRVATVIYKAREQTVRTQGESIWEVKISFDYTGVIIDDEKKNLTFGRFTVTDYKQKRIKT